MPIIIRNSQLNDETMSALNKLLDVEINANVAFKLMKIIKEISSVVEDKKKMEQLIINKHAEKDENGQVIQAEDESGNLIPGGVTIKDMDLFSSDISDFMELENIIDYDKINFEDLNLQTVKVRDLIKLEFLFK